VYEVLLERAAERDLKRIGANQFGRIVSELEALAKEPRPPRARKLTGTKSDWRIRVGEYRIIYEIDDGQKAVRVMRIRHRREAYR